MPSAGPVLPRRGAAIALAGLCLIGFGLRVANIDWDRGHHLHPDERYWSFVTDEVAAPDGVRNYLDASASPLNPYNSFDTFVYGTWPVAVTKASASWLADDGPVAKAATSTLDAAGVDLRDDDGVRFDDGYDANLIGRLLSALFDTAVIGLVYLLARRLGGSAIAGISAATLQTFAVLHIQYSHFYGAETLATFVTTLVVLGSVRLARHGPSTRLLVGVGALVGVATAAKLSTLPVVIAPVTALAVHHVTAMRRTPDRVGGVARAVSDIALLGLSGVIALKLTLPYAFDQWWGLHLGDWYLADLDYLGAVNDGTFNVPWTIQWIGRSRLLGPLSSAFWLGLGPALGLAVVAGIALAARRLRRGELWWAVPLAFIAVEIITVALQFNGLIRYLLPAYPVAIALAGIAVAAMVDLARRSHLGVWPRRVAGAAALVVVAGTMFWGLAFTNGVYGRDHSRLAATDWIAANVPAGSAVSHSVWDDTLPLPEPDAQRLGLTVVDLEPFTIDSATKVETLIAGLDQVDYVIESSNRLYDSITRFPARYPATVAYYDALFADELGFTQVARFTNEPSLLGISIDDGDAEETFTVYDHPTVTIWQKTGDWSPALARRLLDPDRADNVFDTAHIDAGANALQLTPGAYEQQQSGGTFTDVFADDGPTSTASWLWWLVWIEVAGLAAVPWVTWLFGRAAARGYAFTKVAGLLAATVPLWFLVATGMVDYSRGAAWWSLAVVVGAGSLLGYRRRVSLAAHWALHRRSWLVVEALFVGVFVALVALASANPDLWHPFVGGEKPMEVAYFTAITRSSTLPAYDPWFAGGVINYYYLGFFILSVPTKALGIMPEVAFNLGLPTMAATAATALFGVGQVVATAMTPRPTRRTLLLPGVLTAAAVLLIGNLEAALQWARSPGDRYDWWAPSRVNDGQFDITEFPFWSLLFRDLHPHVIDIAVVALVVGLAATYAITARSGDRRRSLALAAALGAATGVVRMVHTWDLPVVVLIGGGALIAGHIAGSGSIAVRVRRLLADALVLGAVHVVLTTPYVANIEVFDGAIERADEVTRFGDFVSQFGLFVMIGIGYALLRLHELRPHFVLTDGWGLVALCCAVTAGGVALVAVGATLAFSVSATIVFAAIAAASARDNVGHTTVAGLFALGLATAGGVDVVTVVNDIDRLNTVFKFWYQSWQLLAIAAALGGWYVAERFVHATRTFSPTQRTVGGALMGVTTMALIASLVYPVLAPGARLDERFVAAPAGLDGIAYLEADPTYRIDDNEINLGDDLPLIEWLRTEVDGSPTVVEAAGPIYSWTARMSIHTGLPTVIGWDWHQIQQRRDYSDQVLRRKADVEAFYRSTDVDAASRFLRRYDVAYVVVGTLEHLYGDPQALAMFAGHPALVEEFRDGRYAIYRVDHDALLDGYG